MKTRKATPNDKNFLWELKVASMRQYVNDVYGWDDSAQDGFFETGFHPEDTKIIQLDEVDIGMYELQEREDDWFLARIEILPEFQNRGIGTAIIQRMVQEAAITGKPFRLQVFKVNPARRLYGRLGFLKVGETETHIYMELPTSACNGALMLDIRRGEKNISVVEIESLRNWRVKLGKREVQLFPEFELTDYPPKVRMSAEMAEACVRQSTADVVIAGFVETADQTQFSSCVTIDGSNAYIVRKTKPSRTEVGTISGSSERLKYFRCRWGTR